MHNLLKTGVRYTSGILKDLKDLTEFPLRNRGLLNELPLTDIEKAAIKNIEDRISAQIKAAREEVLEWAYNRIVHPEASITLGLSPTKLVEIRDYIRQAYKERYEQG